MLLIYKQSKYKRFRLSSGLFRYNWLDSSHFNFRLTRKNEIQNQAISKFQVIKRQNSKDHQSNNKDFAKFFSIVWKIYFLSGHLLSAVLGTKFYAAKVDLIDCQISLLAAKSALSC